jgi:hypothetical protein
MTNDEVFEILNNIRDKNSDALIEWVEHVFKVKIEYKYR